MWRAGVWARWRFDALERVADRLEGRPVGGCSVRVLERLALAGVSPMGGRARGAPWRGSGRARAMGVRG